jgi:hypothetical protein
MCGLGFLRQILAAEIEQGAVLHREDGELAISVDELFCLHKIE